MSFIVVDLGGTQIRAACCRADGHIEARVVLSTRAVQGPEAVIQRIEQAIRRVWPGERGPAAIGVAAPGPLDARTGVILFAPNLPGWRDVPLGPRLADTFARPTFLANDANLAALGEHRFGAGRGVDDLVYLTISTGIGGGIILNGRLFEGGAGRGGGPHCRRGRRPPVCVRQSGLPGSAGLGAGHCQSGRRGAGARRAIEPGGPRR